MCLCREFMPSSFNFNFQYFVMFIYTSLFLPHVVHGMVVLSSVETCSQIHVCVRMDQW